METHSILIVLESEYRMNTKSGQIPLYPHEIDKFIIVVPNLLERKSILIWSIIQMPLISVWALGILFFSTCRKIIRTILKTRNNHFSAILLNTFGLSFGTAGETKSTSQISSSEHLLLWFLSIFAMFASILFSGMLFLEFSTSTLVPSINSLEDLGKFPHIDIWLPTRFDANTETWLNQQ